MKVIAYLRVSTDGQVGEDKFGLEAQEKAIVEYCNKNNMEIALWVKDEGESGAKERPGFDSIVYDIVPNEKYDAVVVAKSDRVARDIKIYYYYKMLLQKHETNLISISEDFGQFGAFATMLEAFTLCVAEMERENITKRTSNGRKVKAAKGAFSGGRNAYGYFIDNGELKVNEKEAEVVRFVFEEVDNGISDKTILGKLKEKGIKTRSGKDLTYDFLYKMKQKRKLYEGYYKYSDSEWIVGKQQAILCEV